MAHRFTFTLLTLRNRPRKTPTANCRHLILLCVILTERQGINKLRKASARERAYIVEQCEHAKLNRAKANQQARVMDGGRHSSGCPGINWARGARAHPSRTADTKIDSFHFFSDVVRGRLGHSRYFDKLLAQSKILAPAPNTSTIVRRTKQPDPAVART